ncbi:hypothetical protein ACVWZL_004667 [Bradyrhizobium sp. GM2.4]
MKMRDSGVEPAAGASYAYKASLIGSAHRFELTEEGLSWHIAGRTSLWRYDEISAIRLSFRPVSMQQHRFRADVSHTGGGRIAILSTSWQTAALMAPQDNGFRNFIVGLHARMAQAGSHAELTRGSWPQDLRDNAGFSCGACSGDDGAPDPGACDRRIRRRAVHHRFCRAVRLADRRLRAA